MNVLAEKNFRDFMDGGFWKIPINLVFRRGCFTGNHFLGWISGLLQAKITRLNDIVMSDLNGAVIYASKRGAGTVTFDSKGEHKDTAAAFATRCSMSIPLVFVPAQIEGHRVYDGGLRNNFPVGRFLSDHPGRPFIALYLSGQPRGKRPWMGRELLDILIDGEERSIVDSHRGDVVVIDPSPVGTVDFDLQPLEKQFLLKVGRAAALKFLQSRNLDEGPEANIVEEAHREAEEHRAAVKRMRRRRRIIHMLAGLILVLLVYKFGFVTWQLCLKGWHVLRTAIL
jgi:predicted acylesterase/phospholipase RssA